MSQNTYIIKNIVRSYIFWLSLAVIIGCFYTLYAFDYKSIDKNPAHENIYINIMSGFIVSSIITIVSLYFEERRKTPYLQDFIDFFGEKPFQYFGSLAYLTKGNPFAIIEENNNRKLIKGIMVTNSIPGRDKEYYPKDFTSLVSIEDINAFNAISRLFTKFGGVINANTKLLSTEKKDIEETLKYIIENGGVSIGLGFNVVTTVLSDYYNTGFKVFYTESSDDYVLLDNNKKEITEDHTQTKLYQYAIISRISIKYRGNNVIIIAISGYTAKATEMAAYLIENYWMSLLKIYKEKRRPLDQTMTLSIRFCARNGEFSYHDYEYIIAPLFYNSNLVDPTERVHYKKESQ